MMWKESGGPPVSLPKTAGFGGALIDGGLPRAVVHREFRPDGLVCTMQIPLERTSPDEMAGQI
jgi:two-component system CheB/CheR fusion protein